MILVVFVIFITPRLIDAFALNNLAIDTVQVALSGVHNYLATLFRIPPSNCRSDWFQGFLAQSQANLLVRDASWQDAIDCMPEYIRLLHIMYPENQGFAEYATQVRPRASEGWFWLAEKKGEYTNKGIYEMGGSSPDEVIELFRKGLAFNPNDGVRWRELGDVIRPSDPQSAIEAY